MHNISLTILCCALRQLCGVIFAFRLHATRQLEIICLIIYAFKYFFDSIYTQSRSSFSLVSLIFVSSNTVKLEIWKSCFNIDFSSYIMEWRIKIQIVFKQYCDTVWGMIKFHMVRKWISLTQIAHFISDRVVVL